MRRAHAGESGSEATSILAKSRILVVVAVVAAAIAVLLYLSFQTGESDTQLAEIEQKLKAAQSQLDSLNSTVDELNSRIDDFRANMDSARSSNVRLVASLRSVSAELGEYRRIAKKQREQNQALNAELRKIKSERDRSMTKAESLERDVENLSTELYDQRVRLARIEARLHDEASGREVATEALSSVLVHIGTADDLVAAGYLKIKSTSIFTSGYILIGYPEQIVGAGSRVRSVNLGTSLPLPGELRAVADRHGKLKRGREYERETDEEGKVSVTFTDSTLIGQRLLIVLK